MTKLIKYPERIPFDAEESVGDAIAQARQAVENMYIGLGALTEEIFLKCQHERSAKRQEIIEQYSGPSRKHIRFSSLFFTKRVRKTGMSLRWDSGWRAKKGNDKLPNKVMFNYVEKKGGIYDINSLLVGAHEDEQALIAQHEKERRALEESWTRYYVLKRKLEAFENQFDRKPMVGNDQEP